MTIARRSRRRLLAAALAIATTVGLAAAASTASARPHGTDGLGAAYNGTPITIAPPTGSGQTQQISNYPSAATVWGYDGPITDVDVNLLGVYQGTPEDLDILLVSPSGTAVVLVSDVCGSSEPVANATWRIDDQATYSLPSLPGPLGGGSCGSGTYQPTNLLAGDPFPATAPASGHRASLSAFNGENPNGTWQLFVHDDRSLPAHPYDTGGLLAGFSVVITTATQQIVVPGGVQSEGPASKYPFTVPVSGQVGRIQDVYVYLHNISHTRPDDLDVLLVAPGGQKIMLVSDSCGHFPTANTRTWRINDRDPAMSDNGNCNLGGAGGAGNNFAPTDHEPGDVLPAPAPPGPYSTSLTQSLFGTDPNGEWKVFIHDDYTGHSGYVRDVTLSFDLGPVVDDTLAPDTSITTKPGATTTSRRATFGFAATESNSTFECKLDARAWAPCSSPQAYQRLTYARHTFRVRATDAAGNTDATPATWRWRVRR